MHKEPFSYHLDNLRHLNKTLGAIVQTSTSNLLLDLDSSFLEILSQKITQNGGMIFIVRDNTKKVCDSLTETF